MTKLVMVVFASAAATLAGCSGDSSAKPVAFADVIAGIHGANCQRWVRCGLAKDQDSCLAARALDDSYVSTTEMSAVASGRTTYDANTVRKCLDELAAGSCDITDPANRVLPVDCQTYLQGTVAGGGACFYDFDCSSGKCAIPSSGEVCRAGTCSGDDPLTPVSVGASCETDQCDVNSYCDAQSLTCSALKPASALCETPDECEAGLYCLNSTATCGKLPALGAACDPSDGCQDLGTACSPASQTCVPVALLGGACANDGDCSFLYACDVTTQMCTSGIALGQPCTPGQLCAGAGAFCQLMPDTSTSICVLPQADGQPCTNGPQCTSHVCDVTQTCVADQACE